MSLKRVGSVVIAVGLVLFSFITLTIAEEKIPPAKEELIEELIEITGLKEHAKSFCEKQFLIAEVICKDSKDTSGNSWPIKNEWIDDFIKDEYYPVFNERFTEDELRDLIKLFKSPLVAKFVKVAPELNKNAEKAFGEVLPWIAIGSSSEVSKERKVENETVEKSLKELREITEEMRQIDRSFGEKVNKMLKKSEETMQQFQDKMKCSDNLRKISRALHMYAADHDEKFPESLNDLYPKYISESDILRCPAKNVPYTYVKGLTEFNSDTVIAYDASVKNHGDGRNILFVLGHTKWCKEEEFQKLLQKTKKTF